MTRHTKNGWKVKMSEDKTFQSNWANSLQLSGVIAQKPLFQTIKTKSGKEIERATFILAQPNYIDRTGKDYVKRIYCCTYSKKAIEVLKSIERQVVVTCLGMISVSATKSGVNYYPHIEEVRLTEVLRTKLEPNKSKGD